MKVSLDWLKDFVDIDVPIHALCDVLTKLGLEVSSVEVINENVNGIVAAKIQEVKTAPDDEKMFICEMFTGKEKLICLSRAPGLKKGQLIPLALPGAVIPDGTIIEIATFGSRESHGMLLSEKELGLATESPTVLFLDENEIKVGENIIKALKLDDHVIDIELTANRSDCLSIFGVAREIAAFYKLPLHIEKLDLTPYLFEVEPKIELSITEKILCPCYIGREIRNIKITPSPLWIKRRLTALGSRPINNIVDITNYIMFETGQPLHAFDSSLLKGNNVIVRFAKDKEKITLLDGQELELTKADLLIADAERPIALAGVMGGDGSQISDSTTDLFLECANFSPHNIRRTSKRFGISTDSSYRFERGVDPFNSLDPSGRASELIAKLSGGKILRKIAKADYLSPEPKKIFLQTKEVSRLLGVDIEKDLIIKTLKNLHFEVFENENGLLASPPSFRLDVERDVDLIEDIARFIGYDNFEAKLPVKSLTAGRNGQRRIFETKIKEIFTSCGLFEITTITLINEALLQKALLFDIEPYDQYVRLKNPLNKEQSIMRPTLLISLLNCIKHNINHHKKDVPLFELSPVYLKNEKQNYKEPLRLSGAIIEGADQKNWRAELLKYDFFYIKGIIEKIFSEFNIKEVSFEKEVIPFFKHGESASIKLKDKILGFFGRLNPKVAENFEVTDSCFLFEIDLELLFDNSDFSVKIEELPKFPSITLDIALVVDETVSAKELKKIILEEGVGIVENVVLFDIYKGKPLDNDKKSVAFSIVYRSTKKTLTFDEVDVYHRRILESLKEKTGAHFRT